MALIVVFFRNIGLRPPRWREFCKEQVVLVVNLLLVGGNFRLDAGICDGAAEILDKKAEFIY